MEISRTPEGLVTPLALVRTVRKETATRLGRSIGVDDDTIIEWERGISVPKGSQLKRLGLALRWPWRDFLTPPMTYAEAEEHLCRSRKRIAELRESTAS